MHRTETVSGMNKIKAFQRDEDPDEYSQLAFAPKSDRKKAVRSSMHGLKTVEKP